MNKLGEVMLLVAFSIKGKTSKKECFILIKKIMDSIEVKPVHHAMLYDYPVGGKGGKGFTCIQPITESFIAFDAWPDLKGAYLIISSCRLFWVNNVVRVVRSLGFKILDTRINELCLLKDELTVGD